jgi:hypothetical protein
MSEKLTSIATFSAALSILVLSPSRPEHWFNARPPPLLLLAALASSTTRLLAL